MRERGSALLTTVVAVMVLLLISGILFSFVSSQFKMITGEEKALKAYYLAEAGTSYGIAKMIKEIDNLNDEEIEVVVGHKLPDATIKITNPFGSKYGGNFSIDRENVEVLKIERKVVKDADGNDVVKNTYILTATSEGYYQGIKRTLTKNYAYPLKEPKEIPEI